MKFFFSVFEIIDSSSYKENLKPEDGFVPVVHNENSLLNGEFAELDIGILEVIYNF